MAESYRILLVKVHQMLYPITEEVLHQVFSPHGLVDKIVIFQKFASFEALIQYQSQQSAFSAIISLQGRNIYDGCCQLDIQFSNLGELQEKSVLGNEENLKNQILEDTEVKVKKISQTVVLESETEDETWSVINGNKEVLIGEHFDGDKELVVEEHHLLVESSNVRSSRITEDECSSYVGETNSAFGIGLSAFNENQVTVEADDGNEGSDGMMSTQNLQADISLETKLIKPNGISCLEVTKSQDDAEHGSDVSETDRIELYHQEKLLIGCLGYSHDTEELKLVMTPENQVSCDIRSNQNHHLLARSLSELDEGNGCYTVEYQLREISDILECWVFKTNNSLIVHVLITKCIGVLRVETKNLQITEVMTQWQNLTCNCAEASRPNFPWDPGDGEVAERMEDDGVVTVFFIAFKLGLTLHSVVSCVKEINQFPKFNPRD